MYEIYERLLKSKGVKSSDVSKTTGISNMTLSDWKNGKSTPKPDKLTLIADYFDVSIDFLMGRTKEIECSECGQKYNPFDEFDCVIHDQFHSKILQAQRTYPILIPYKDISKMSSKSLLDIQTNEDNRLASLQNYLKSEFSRYVYMNFEHGKIFNYEDFCKTEVVKLIESGKIPTDYIDDVVTIFQIDKDYINKTDLLLSRVSNNPQMMRILAYAEKLNPGMLDALEVQVKAWSDNNTKG